MITRKSNGGAQLVGTIESNSYKVANLREMYNDWDTLSDSEKLSCLQNVDPYEKNTVTNVTTDKFHEYIVANLDPGVDENSNLSASYMGLGNDASGGTEPSDENLNNRVFSKEVTDHADNGNELLASTFVSSTEANGVTVNEIGLFTKDPGSEDVPVESTNLYTREDTFLINHATFSNIVKNDEITVTFDVKLTFTDS
jgi:hypothetical protein